MLFRPQQAQWFETYIPRNKTVSALEILSISGEIELESDPDLARPLDLTVVQEAVEFFRKLRQQHKDLLYDILPRPTPLLKPPEQIAKESLNDLAAWCQSADDILTRQLQLETERQKLLLLQECLTALQGHSSGFSHMAHKSEFLYKGVFACPHEHRLDIDVCTAVDEFFPGSEHNFFLVADIPAKQAIIEKTYQSESCQHVEVPSWISANPEEQNTQVAHQISIIETQIQLLVEKLEKHKQDSKVSAALENMRLLTWYVDNAQGLSADQTFCHVTGWTKVKKPEDLQLLLEQTGIHATIRFAPTPDKYKPPVNLLLPAWARPFNLFVEMLGTPDRNEVDPILLVPVTVSLLFGYMFPDIGHGLILVLVSVLLYQRWPQGRFLITCGISSILFGIIFGEFFGLEGLLQPLWIKPLEKPLLILLPPLFFGITLMLLGLLFNGIEAHWRGDLRNWLQRDAAVLVMYAAAGVGIFYRPSLWIVALALCWFILGQIIFNTTKRWIHLLTHLGLLIQSLFELLLNTFSFLRVGAFALAHAALTSAVMQLADSIDNYTAQLVFLILGHVLIVTVEGLVVFVQTTRLILFEFFTRFLKAEGRIFRPLSTPRNDRIKTKQ